MKNMEIPKKIFKKYKINNDWFKKNPNSIHGVLHEYRVLIYAYIIGTMEKADVESLCYAAIFHDVRRNNDGYDINHSKRAAKWVKNNFNLKNIEQITQIIYWHTPSDKNIPKITKEIKCFKDADALDRFRIHDFNKNYLRTKSSKKLIDFARELYNLTNKQKQTIKDPLKNILLAIKKINYNKKIFLTKNKKEKSFTQTLLKPYFQK